MTRSGKRTIDRRASPAGYWLALAVLTLLGLSVIWLRRDDVEVTDAPLARSRENRAGAGAGSDRPPVARNARHAAIARGAPRRHAPPDNGAGLSHDASTPVCATPVAAGEIHVRFTDRVDGEPLRGAGVDVRIEHGETRRALRLETDDEGRAVLRDLAEGEHAARFRHPEFLPELRLLRLDAFEPTTEPIEIALTRGARVHGTLEDEGGRPIARGRVILFRAGTDGPERFSTASDAGGRFTLSGVPGGEWAIAAAAASRRPAGPLLVDTAEETPVALVLAAETHPRVRVVDAAGLPVTGAEVLARPVTAVSPFRIGSARSQDDGTARLTALPSDPSLAIELRVRHTDHPTASVEARVADIERELLEIRLEPSRLIEGVVLSAEGEPVSGAVVELSGALRRSLRTTSAGRFSFEHLPAGSWTLRAFTVDRGASEPLSADSTLTVSPVTLRLRPGAGSIAGSVVGADGQTLALVPVRCVGSDIPRETVTDSAGRFRFSGLDGDAFTLLVGDSRRGTARFENLRPDTLDLVVRLEAPGSLRGRVAVAGPARGHTVRATRVRADGTEDPPRVVRFSSQAPSFHLRGVPAGRYRVELRAAGKTLDVVEDVLVPSGGESPDLRLGAPELASLPDSR